MTPEEEKKLKIEIVEKSQRLADFMGDISALFAEGSELTLVVVPPKIEGESVVMTNGCCDRAIEAIEQAKLRDMLGPDGRTH